MNKINYKFKNKKLFEMALTHCSFSKENYERLEYLGDSIFDFIVAEYFYKKTEEDEGHLTKLRSNFVSEQYLSKVFDQLGLLDKIVVGKSYQGEISVSIKADMVEALIAAIYLDSNDISLVRNIIVDLLDLKNYKEFELHDYKTQLQELVQSKNKNVNYRLVNKSGPSHNPVWTMGVYLQKEKIGEGESTSKGKAEQIAAKSALDFLKGEKDD